MGDFAQRFNEIIGKVLADSGLNIKLGSTPHDPARTFPGGFRWRYYSYKPPGRRRAWWFCWSTVKNENGKSISWVYKPVGKDKRLEKSFRELRSRAKCRARAWKMRETFRKKHEVNLTRELE